jgi:hypothetical protein
MRRAVRHPARCTRRAQAAALAAERDDDLVVTCRAAHAREAMGSQVVSISRCGSKPSALVPLAIEVKSVLGGLHVDYRRAV